MSWCCVVALASGLLSACGTARVPAPISEASVELADPPPPPPMIPCAPLIEQPATVVVPHPVHKHHPAPRPVKRAHPVETHPVEKPEEKPDTAPVVPAPVVDVQVVPLGQVRRLLDAEVQRGPDKTIGRAVDAVADAQARPRAIVVNLVGFMGVGDRKVSLPWDAFRFEPVAPKAPLTLTGDSLHPLATAPATGGSPAAPKGSMNLVDATVTSRGGGDGGRVVDILVDASGHARAILLDMSNSLLHDRHMIAAAWSTLSVEQTNDGPKLHIDLDRQQIQAAPKYEPGKPARVVSPVKSASPTVK